MALALNNLKRVDMPLNKETKPNQTYYPDRCVERAISHGFELSNDVFGAERVGFQYVYISGGTGKDLLKINQSIISNMFTRLGLFYVLRLENRVHCTFFCTVAIQEFFFCTWLNRIWTNFKQIYFIHKWDPNR